MGESGNIDLPGGSFSRLLFSIDDDINNNESHSNNNDDNNLLFSSNTPKMLCFGDFGSQFSPSFTSSSVNSITITLLLSNDGVVTSRGFRRASKDGRPRDG